MTDLAQAQKVMGINATLKEERADSPLADTMNNAASDRSLKTFSEDVLELEVQGPDQGHYSIIDVPGIFKVPTEGGTTRDDVAMVQRMVEGYVKNPRSIILVVVPSNVDLATEEILNIAEHFDPGGMRTIGVLTKPDLIVKGAESSILDVLKGRTHRLFHGWGIVRNLGKKESESFMNRDDFEQDFFKREMPWNTLDPKKVGIASLRDRLQKLLKKHTEREFPSV